MLEPRFRRQRIQIHVPRFGEAGFGALTIEGEPDQVRAPPVTPAAAELQRSIIEPAAHPQTPAGRIHSDQGYDDQVQPSRRHGPVHALRHGDPEHAALRLTIEWIKTYAAMTPVDDDRYENAHATARRRSDQCGRIRLPVERQVQRDALPGSEPG